MHKQEKHRITVDKEEILNMLSSQSKSFSLGSKRKTPSQVTLILLSLINKYEKRTQPTFAKNHTMIPPTLHVTNHLWEGQNLVNFMGDLNTKNTHWETLQTLCPHFNLTSLLCLRDIPAHILLYKDQESECNERIS
jgi:hypothetical protein